MSSTCRLPRETYSDRGDLSSTERSAYRHILFSHLANPVGDRCETRCSFLENLRRESRPLDVETERGNITG